MHSKASSKSLNTLKQIFSSLAITLIKIDYLFESLKSRCSERGFGSSLIFGEYTLVTPLAPSKPHIHIQWGKIIHSNALKSFHDIVEPWKYPKHLSRKDEANLFRICWSHSLLIGNYLISKQPILFCKMCEVLVFVEDIVVECSKRIIEWNTSIFIYHK